MPGIETFSKRRDKAQKAGTADVFQYEELPEALRIQIIHIWRSSIGTYGRGQYDEPANNIWAGIHDILAREFGVFSLVDSGGNAQARCERFLQEASIDGALDVIEMSFRFIDKFVRERDAYENEQAGADQAADDAIEELNHRFREHSVGYQYTGGQLIRMDSEYLHAEAVVPALALLRNLSFSGAEQEFAGAHKHYRHKRYKEAITEALKAFESTLKAICDERKWPYAIDATAKGLIQVVFDNGLVPPELQSQFSALRSVLESGLPTVRNKKSGHGQGSQPVSVPDYLAAFALHQAATNIVLLVEAHKAKN